MISVLLPYRDAARTLGEAVASVLADMGTDDELVLIDDGSRDEGPALAARLAAEDGRVRPIASGGVGIARALNHGLAHCRGAFIARMDADDVSLPGRLASQRALLESDPRLGAVATQIEAFGARAATGVQRYVEWQNRLVSTADHERAIFVEAPVCHPSTMIRRAALDELDGYHAGDFAEDYDLWLRLVAAGWGMAKVPAVLFRWRIHGANVTWNDPRLSFAALRRLRARHLAARCPARFGLWGAGAAGTRLARELASNGARPSFFIDIDPLKIGRTRQGVPILTVDQGLARAGSEGAWIIVAVAVSGARDLIRPQLEARGFAELRDFVFAQ